MPIATIAGFVCTLRLNKAFAARIGAADDFSDVPAEARPLRRHSAIMAAAAKDPRLKKRTLTNLYNERPTWLKLAHEFLDRAVLSAYAANDPQGTWSPDDAQLWLDAGPATPLPPTHPLAPRRADTDRRILENLLRLNHARSTATESPRPSPAREKSKKPWLSGHFRYPFPSAL